MRRGARRDRAAVAGPAAGPEPGEPRRTGGDPSGGFVGRDGDADVTVVVVTYNSADHLADLLADLRAAARTLALRVVMVDNSSADGTLAVAARHADVVAVPSGGNLGYAGGINAATPYLGRCSAVLIANPDLRFGDGALEALWRRLWLPGVGVVAPHTSTSGGALDLTLRFEPTILRALGAAFLGGRMPSRPHWLSELDLDPARYREPHAIDWATGAALLVRRTVVDQVGPWSEQYFLYSEEVDYQRRVREAGWSVWYEPAARVQHVGGGSGSSKDLVALLAVNRVRYARGTRGVAYGTAYLGVLAVAELLRVSRPQSRHTLRYLVRRRRWSALPAATRTHPPTDHVLLTRFNLPSEGVEGLIRAQESWLRNRVDLFERYCVPSVAGQTVQDFSWIIYFDPESPDWLRGAIAPHVAAGRFTPIYRAAVSRDELLSDIRQVTGGNGVELITSNLDNDDALAVDFVELVRSAPTSGGPTAIYCGDGLIKSEGRVYVQRDPSNAFCSVREPWAGARTCWSEWHTMLGEHMAAVEVRSAPAWLQVIHGANVSNRVRGRLSSPGAFLDRFPGLLSDVQAPTTSAIRRELLLDRPRRVVRESVRALGKTVVMAVAGKRGVERVNKARAVVARRRRRPARDTSAISADQAA